MSLKIININDPGTTERYGGDDTDKLNKIWSGYDLGFPLDANTETRYRSNKFVLRDVNNLYNINFLTSGHSNNTSLLIPPLTSNHQLVVDDIPQTLKHKTEIFDDLGLQIWDSTSTHKYKFKITQDLAADRQVFLPLLTADDTILFANAVQSIVGKVINSLNNTIANAGVFQFTIFKISSTYFCRNNQTGLFLTSGTVFETVLQAAVSAGGTIYIAPGTYTFSNAFASIVFPVSPIYTKLVMDPLAILTVPNGYAGDVFLLNNTATAGCWNNTVEGGQLNEAGSIARNWTGVRLRCSSNGSVQSGCYHNSVKNVTILYPNVGIALEADSTATLGFINQNYFEQNIIYGAKTAFIDFQMNLAYNSAFPNINRNRFFRCLLQATNSTDATIGVRNIRHKENSFIDMYVVDFSGSNLAGSTIHTDAQHTRIEGGTMDTYNFADNSTTQTTRMITETNHLKIPRITPGQSGTNLDIIPTGTKNVVSMWDSSSSKRIAFQVGTDNLYHITSIRQGTGGVVMPVVFEMQDVPGASLLESFRIHSDAVARFLSSKFAIRNPANTFQYLFNGSAILADRTVTLPLLTTNDQFTFDNFPTTLTQKTIVLANNTLTDTSTALGDLIKHDGTHFVKFAKGTSSQVLGVNAAGTDLAWLILASTVNYTIRRVSSSSYIAINNKTGVIDASNSGDLGALLNSIFALLPNGGTIYIEGNSNPYVTSTPALIPVQNAATVKMYVITGDIQATRSAGGTEISFSSTFPTGRYCFESVATIGSNQTSTFWLNGLYVQNVLYAKSGTAGQNISAGSTVIDAGFLLFASDHSTNIPFIITNITTQYLWEGMHFKGYMFFPKIHNYRAADINNNCVSNAHIIMEKAGYPDYPKQFDIQQMVLNSTAGLSGGTGSLNNAAVFGGGYHYIQNVYVDGTKYNEAPIAFKQFFSSTVKQIQVIDLNVAQGAGYKGVYLFDSNDYAGNAPTTAYDTYNNVFENLAGGNSTSSLVGLYFANGAFRNRIKCWGYWGGTIQINDAGAGIENLVEVVEGQQPKLTPNAKVTTTNGIVKVKDLRVGAENYGVMSFNGDGTNKVFSIPHGLYTTPVNYRAEKISAAAQGSADVSVTSSNIVITYQFPPPPGTNNVTFSWFGSVNN